MWLFKLEKRLIAKSYQVWQLTFVLLSLISDFDWEILLLISKVTFERTGDMSSFSFRRLFTYITILNNIFLVWYLAFDLAILLLILIVHIWIKLTLLQHIFTYLFYSWYCLYIFFLYFNRISCYNQWRRIWKYWNSFNQWKSSWRGISFKYWHPGCWGPNSQVDWAHHRRGEAPKCRSSKSDQFSFWQCQVLWYYSHWSRTWKTCIR